MREIARITALVVSTGLMLATLVSASALGATHPSMHHNYCMTHHHLNHHQMMMHHCPSHHK
jgi:hypothetical protein